MANRTAAQVAGDLVRRFGISMPEALILARAERVLHRWHELECGDGDNHNSWAIVRDEASGRPFMEVHPHQGKTRREPIPDREKGALKRVADVCQRNGLNFYQQGDPRGCALYVAREPLTDENYNNGAAVC